MSALNTLRLFWKIGFLEKLLVNMTLGKEFGKAITKFPPNHYQYKKGTIRQAQRDGINYELDLSDLVDWYIYFGFKEPSRMNLYNLVSEGMTVLDIGANVGDITMHLSKFVGANGKVHSFEPDPVNFKRISKNLSLNDFNNIQLNNLGLGAESAKLNIIVRDENNRGMNQMVKGEAVEGQVQIDIMKLDDYVSSKNIDKIDVIKIDVEGFDLEVLKGASDTLDKFHPKLFIELDDRCLRINNGSASELVEYLANKGYKITHAETGNNVAKDDNFENCHYDIIAKA